MVLQALNHLLKEIAPPSHASTITRVDYRMRTLKMSVLVTRLEDYLTITQCG